MLEAIDHSFASLTFLLVDLLIAAKHAVDRRRLLVPIVHRDLVPCGLTPGTGELLVLLLIARFHTTFGRCGNVLFNKDRVELTLPHLAEGLEGVAVDVLACGTCLLELLQALSHVFAGHSVEITCLCA